MGKKLLGIFMILVLLLPGCGSGERGRDIDEIMAEKFGLSEQGEGTSGSKESAADRKESEAKETAADKEEPPENTVVATVAATATTSPKPVTPSPTQAPVLQGDWDGDFKKEMEEVANGKQSFCYYYGLLPADQQKLYREILNGIHAHEETVRVSSVKENEISAVYDLVLLDHPELFWVNSEMGYTRTTRGEEVWYTFNMKYPYSAEECAAYQLGIDAFVEKCLNGIPARADDYEIVKYVYEYVIRNTEYDLNAKDNQNILSVFLNGESVCNGYSKAVQYLLLCADIPCSVVSGSSKGESHAWNMVKIDGDYYFLDVTWGDQKDYINYDYLNITTKDISIDHTADRKLQLPECNATEANYYVREGCYVTAWQPQKIEEIFSGAEMQGDRTIRFRCSSREVFKECEDRLFTKNEIYSYLPESVRSTRYAQDDDFLSFIIMY